MNWINKINKMREAVTAKKAAIIAEEIAPELCHAHGYAACMRCAEEEFNSIVVSHWQSLEDNDVRQSVTRLPYKVQEMMKDIPKKVILAGGFIRAVVANESIRDIDIFVKDQATATLICHEQGISKTLAADGTHYDCSNLNIPLQIVWRYEFTEIQNVLEAFDYTVCKAGIWYDDIQKSFVGVCHGRFYKDLARKILVYDSDTRVEDLLSIPRMLKYVQRGYNIDPDSLATLMTKTCLCLDLENGFDGVVDKFRKSYSATGMNEEWLKINAPKEIKKDVARTGYSSNS